MMRQNQTGLECPAIELFNETEKDSLISNDELLLHTLTEEGYKGSPALLRLRSAHNSQDPIDKIAKSFLKRLCRAASRRVFLLVIVFIAVTACSYSYVKDISTSSSQIKASSRGDSSISHSSSSQISYRKNHINRNLTKILLWNTYGKVTSPKHVSGKCGFCTFTTNRTMINESKAVVIHYRNTSILPDPLTRKLDQIYVWLCRESPETMRNYLHFNFFDKRLYNYFNATMTYRRDSVIYHPYVEKIYRYPQSESKDFVGFYQENLKTLLSQKRHLAFWVVSNCNHSGSAKYRFAYVQSLIKAGLKVDRYGACFPGKSFPAFRSDEGRAKMSRYKFYLAFENSYHCRDYITEKTWDNAIYSGAVPIIWGPTEKDLRDFLPPHSYISIEAYKDVQELVDHINYLDGNDSAYMEFFSWRTLLGHRASFSVDNPGDTKLFLPEQTLWGSMLSKNSTFGFCDLCRVVSKRPQQKIGPIPSLEKWWYGTENQDCR